jgi:hypothetical protein
MANLTPNPHQAGVPARPKQESAMRKALILAVAMTLVFGVIAGCKKGIRPGYDDSSVKFGLFVSTTGDIKYEISDAGTGQRLTRGYSVQVAVDATTGEMLLASPAVLYRKLGIEES